MFSTVYVLPRIYILYAYVYNILSASVGVRWRGGGQHGRKVYMVVSMEHSTKSFILKPVVRLLVTREYGFVISINFINIKDDFPLCQSYKRNFTAYQFGKHCFKLAVS